MAINVFVHSLVIIHDFVLVCVHNFTSLAVHSSAFKARQQRSCLSFELTDAHVTPTTSHRPVPSLTANRRDKDKRSGDRLSAIPGYMHSGGAATVNFHLYLFILISSFQYYRQIFFCLGILYWTGLYLCVRGC